MEKSLTKADVDLALSECVEQDATDVYSIRGMLTAMLDAKAFAREERYNPAPVFSAPIEEKIILWAEMIDDRNAGQHPYRYVPVHFGKGLGGPDAVVPAPAIERAMHQFCGAFDLLDFENADDMYVEFERIHPFVDGNGRVGLLLWLVYHCWQSGTWQSSTSEKIARSWSEA